MPEFSGALRPAPGAPAAAAAAPRFVHTAIGGAYVRVLVDGIEISKHSAQHTAAMAAETAKAANPAARVVYKPEFEIEVTLK